MLAGGALINSQVASDGWSSVEAPESSAEEPMRKEVAFEGLRVELFEDVADPAAAAEGSQVSSAVARVVLVNLSGVCLENGKSAPGSPETLQFTCMLHVAAAEGSQVRFPTVRWH